MYSMSWVLSNVSRCDIICVCRFQWTHPPSFVLDDPELKRKMNHREFLTNMVKFKQVWSENLFTNNSRLIILGGTIHKLDGGRKDSPNVSHALR